MNGWRAVAAFGTFSVLLAGCAVTDRVTDFVGGGRCAEDYSFPIYFSENSADLTPIVLTTIDNAIRQGGECHVRGVRVTGMADATGDAAANLELSARRASAVSTALIARGITAPLDVQAVGDTEALTATGQREPVARRTEITFHYDR